MLNARVRKGSHGYIQTDSCTLLVVSFLIERSLLTSTVAKSARFQLPKTTVAVQGMNFSLLRRELII